MKSMNFIISPGALMFLLLVVGLGLADEEPLVGHGGMCASEGSDAPVKDFCKEKERLHCALLEGSKFYDDEVTPDVYAGALISTNPDKIGICVCPPVIPLYKNHTCVRPRKKYGETCTYQDLCLRGSDLTCRVGGEPAAKVGEPDKTGYTDVQNAHKGSQGKCVCADATKPVWKDNKCQPQAKKPSSGSDRIGHDTASLKLGVAGALMGSLLLLSSS